MRNYTQLTQVQRYQIWVLRRAGHSQAEIGRFIGLHRSTVCRELLRNRGQRSYRPKQAQRLARLRRRCASRHVRIDAGMWSQVEDRLRRQWSPEQIAGRLRIEGRVRVSHEWIYQHILADRRAGGDLYRQLRCQRQRHKRYGHYSRRGQMPGRVSIEQRPSIVDEKSRIGDWEVDLIIGHDRRTALLTLTERKSKLALLRKLRRRLAPMVTYAMLKLLKPLADRVFTVTADNGREFAQHQRIARQLRAGFFFAHPYASWERGLNENTNGLIRQYFPKRSSFFSITRKAVRTVMDRLNNRPRKSLAFLTPNEVFFNQPPVALRY